MLPLGSRELMLHDADPTRSNVVHVASAKEMDDEPFLAGNRQGGAAPAAMLA